MKKHENKYYYSINQYAALYIKAGGKEIGVSKQYISELIKKRLSEDGTEAELPNGVVAIKVDEMWVIISKNNLAKNQQVKKK